MAWQGPPAVVTIAGMAAEGLTHADRVMHIGAGRVRLLRNGLAAMARQICNRAALGRGLHDQGTRATNNNHRVKRKVSLDHRKEPS